MNLTLNVNWTNNFYIFYLLFLTNFLWKKRNINYFKNIINLDCATGRVFFPRIPAYHLSSFSAFNRAIFKKYNKTRLCNLPSRDRIFFLHIPADTVHHQNFLTQTKNDGQIDPRMKEVSQKRGTDVPVWYRCSDKTVSRRVSFEDSEIYVRVYLPTGDYLFWN